MKRWWKKPRKLVVGGEVWRWSVLDRSRCQELRVWREGEKRPAFLLRLTWPETWGIDLFRPGTAACVIAWFAGQRRREPALLTLKGEPELLEALLNLSFSPAEQGERARFLARVRSASPPPHKWEW